ncbi:MAG: ribbon-helix-helix protein, CopG family [Hormoscilla sp. GUM202]|nr:ribbon-helix-helix protein, CopG family [Hormoscilla sp. GUM202]
MVKKSIDIPEAQDEALMTLAQNLGVSEEELIRQALAEFLLHAQYIKPPLRDGSGVERFIARAEEISKKHRLPEGYRFNRDELYGEYNARL